MGRTKWTEEQQRAITEKGSNILVSAGAGSGKTAVLTERIVTKLKEGISLEELVVLTFTNAAAFEMKERVRKKLLEEIENGATDLEEQLDLLDSASICTFDSFSLSLVKKYHYLLGIDKNVSICDTVVLEMQKKKIMEDVIHSFFERKDEKFLRFMDTFTMKDSTKIEKVLLSFSSKLESLYHKEEYLKHYLENFYSLEKIEQNIAEYTEIIRKKIGPVFVEIERMDSKIGDPLLLAWFEKLRNILLPLESANTYDAIASALPPSLPSLPSSQKIDEEEKEEIKENYVSLRKAYDAVKELTSYQSIDEIKEEIYRTKESIEVVLSLLKEYEERLLEFKKGHSLFEFSDIGRFGVQILEKYPSICLEYREKIKEIMIDEYQDTNDIGDYFISLIAHDNIYMVGDVKQSIYGFRNANPTIFMEKYDAYAKEKGGIKIDLMKNFRSRKEVLSSINFIFERIMDTRVGGADYPNGHEMIFGNKVYEEEETSYDHMVELYTYEEDKSFRKEEIEAFLIGQDIRKKVEEKYPVLDKKTNHLRPCQYEDFTILMDRKTDFDLYKKIFTYLKIPLYIHKEESFVESSEIYVIQNICILLNAIQEKDFYSSTFSHAFLSVGRSFLFSYKDDVLFSLFLEAKEKKESLYTAFLENPFFTEMYNALHNVLVKMQNLSLKEIVKEIYKSFSFYTKIETLGNPSLLSAKLTYLIDVCASLEDLGYGLSHFITYLQTASKEKLDVSFKMESENGAAVSMMTIHKSKGLEFPICYYAGLYKTFSKEDFKDRFLWNPKYGFVVPVFEEGLKDTIYKTLVKENYYEKDISEKIRLFYVALTRAKEKMILVSPSPKEYLDIEEKVPTELRLQYRSFKDMIYSLQRILLPFTKSFLLTDLSITKDYEKIVRQEILHRPIQQNIETFSLSLEKERRENTLFSSASPLLDEKTKDNIEIGKKIHACLENIPFLGREEFYQKYSISPFFREKIEAFFSTPFLPNLENATIYREYEFVSIEGNVGIIDLLIETEDTIYVIDYKLREIDKESYIKQVQSYMKYIQSITHKKIEGYLYSILEERYKNIILPQEVVI